jgi:hypothetical protein
MENILTIPKVAAVYIFYIVFWELHDNKSGSFWSKLCKKHIRTLPMSVVTGEESILHR